MVKKSNKKDIYGQLYFAFKIVIIRAILFSTRSHNGSQSQRGIDRENTIST
ncbi:hypothetical protein Cha6605_4177 [Chamaesiphon minutus PCC 6605]|uniref:Uncharacterized protein n=1 Tax=Chamaesiphon minutus (strain ATCC 27169 / PCC 6605) TaxID=1173020 RepID=K9UJ32_CHAP6|nr:hypothetical protein Cha6605_4177 [Chamaesiphon minutus PCC 6605]